MNASEFQRAENAVLAALEMDPRERDRFLSRLRTSDPGIAAHVERLVGLDEQSRRSFATFGEHSPGQPDPLADPLIGRSVGAYQLLRVVGAGGMGRVYEARQRTPDRRVAVKVIGSRFFPEAVLRRFRQEAQILGSLNHPGICGVLEAGIASVGIDAIPFIAMEFVDGVPLDVGAGPLKLRQRVQCMAEVCDAVGHAHAQGILHRDLKPGNILLLRLQPGSPGAAPSCKVLDFGVARAMQDGAETWTLTLTGQPIGTPRYMSPEQASALETDARSDVYSLGIILRELLEPPGDSSANPRRKVRREPRPSDASIPKELRIIAAKATEHDPARRYTSGIELAEDLHRYLERRPILARTPTLIYRLHKLVARNKALTIAAAVVLAALGAITWTLLNYLDANSSRKLVQLLAEDQRFGEYLTCMQEADAAVKGEDIAKARERLDAAPVDLRGWEWMYLNSTLDRSIQRWSIPSEFTGHAPTAIAVDGDSVVIAFDDSCARFTRGRPDVLSRKLSALASLAWDTDLKQAESAGHAWLAQASNNGITITASDTGSSKPVLFDGTRAAQAVAFSTGTPGRVLGGVGGLLVVWDAMTGDRLAVLRGHSGPIDAVASGADGYVWTASSDGTVRCWEPSLDGDFERISRGEFATHLPFTSIGRFATPTGSFDILDWKTQQPVARIGPFPTVPYRFALTTDHRWVVMAGVLPDGVHVVNVADHAVLGHRSGFQYEDRYMGVDEVRGRVSIGGASGILRVFSLPTLDPLLSFPLGSEITEGAISPDGSKIAVVHPNAVMRVYSLLDGKPICDVETRGTFPIYTCFSDDGELLAAVNYKELNLNLWDARNGRLLRRVMIPDNPQSLTKLPGYRRLAVGTFRGTVYLYPFERAGGNQSSSLSAPWTPTLVLHCTDDSIHKLAASPDGRTLLGDSHHNLLFVWRIGPR